MYTNSSYELIFRGVIYKAKVHIWNATRTVSKLLIVASKLLIVARKKIKKIKLDDYTLQPVI